MKKLTLLLILIFLSGCTYSNFLARLSNGFRSMLGAVPSVMNQPTYVRDNSSYDYYEDQSLYYQKRQNEALREQNRIESQRLQEEQNRQLRENQSGLMNILKPYR